MFKTYSDKGKDKKAPEKHYAWIMSLTDIIHLLMLGDLDLRTSDVPFLMWVVDLLLGQAFKVIDVLGFQNIRL